VRGVRGASGLLPRMELRQHLGRPIVLCAVRPDAARQSGDCRELRGLAAEAHYAMSRTDQLFWTLLRMLMNQANICALTTLSEVVSCVTSAEGLEKEHAAGSLISVFVCLRSTHQQCLLGTAGQAKRPSGWMMHHPPCGPFATRSASADSCAIFWMTLLFFTLC